MTLASDGKRTDDQVALEAEFKAACAGDPVAEMVLALHRLDETGQCAECREVAVGYVTGYEYEIDEVTWPCETTYSVRRAVYGWSVEQVEAVEFQCYRQIAGRPWTPGRPWNDFGFTGDQLDAMARREEWVTSGIPAHRAVLFATADIPLAEALALEASAESGDALDAALTTLVGLTL